MAFPQEGIVRDPGAAELMDEAIKEGCDIVGGLPWYEYTDAEAREHIDICFDLAKKHDLDIHMLVDDTDDANSRSLEYLALKTMREGFQGRVAASHCGAMAGYNDVYAAKIIDMVATAGVTISVNAHINLVCSARLDREPKRRGIARVKELLARGANVVTSQDDVNDPYYPFGKPDPLGVRFDDRACRAAHAAARARAGDGHGHRQCGESAPASTDYGIAPGKTRRPVVVGAPSVHEALRLQPPRRHVFRKRPRGRALDVTQELAELATASMPHASCRYTSDCRRQAQNPSFASTTSTRFTRRAARALKAVDDVTLRFPRRASSSRSSARPAAARARCC